MSIKNLQATSYFSQMHHSLEGDSALGEYLYLVLHMLAHRANRNLEHSQDIRDFGREMDELFEMELFSDTSLNISESLKKLLIDTSRGCSISEIAASYEYFDNKSANKKSGQFYTPSALVEEMFGRVRLKDRVILDPACGTGLFLLHAVEKLKQFFSASDSNELLAYIESHLFGIDIHKRTTDLCRVFILTSIFENPYDIPKKSLLKNNIITGNTLLLDTQQPFSFNDTQTLPIHSVDLIIGNPPYGLSRNKQIESRELKRLKERFSEKLKGKPNKYMLFLLRCYELLKPQGELVFIVPNAWLGVRSGIELRKIFLNDTSLKEIVVFSKPVFPLAKVETVIVHLEKEKQQEVIVSQKEAPLNIEDDRQLISYEIWKENPDNMLPTRWSETASKVFSLLDKHCTTLSESYFHPAIALQAYSRGKGNPKQTNADVTNHVFHSETQKNKDCYPYLEGKDVSRFSHAKPRSFLHYGPHLAEPQNIQRFTGARIVVREILGKKPFYFQACLITEVILYNKSVLHILLKDKTKVNELKALACILNSRFASFVLHYRGRKSQRNTFPKIVNDDLRDFPWPKNDSTYLQELSICYEKMVSALKKGKEKKIEQIQEKIDILTCKAYDIEQFRTGIEKEIDGTR